MLPPGSVATLRGKWTVIPPSYVPVADHSWTEFRLGSENQNVAAWVYSDAFGIVRVTKEDHGSPELAYVRAGGGSSRTSLSLIFNTHRLPLTSKYDRPPGP